MTTETMTTSDKTRIQNRLRKIQDGLTDVITQIDGVKTSGTLLVALAAISLYLEHDVAKGLEEVLEDEAWG